MNIISQLSSSAAAAVKALYGQEAGEGMLQLQKTKREFEGHFTLVVFPLLKISHKKPEDTAREIGEYLQREEPCVASFNVVKGFLNIVVSPGAWLSLLDDINADEHYGETAPQADAPLVMIEYSSPNTNKPLHLGHVRNNLLGWSLARIMEANGNRVVKTNIVNDRGIHICKSMLAWLKWGEGETPESSGKKGDHLIGDYYVAFDKHYREEVKEFEEHLEENLRQLQAELQTRTYKTSKYAVFVKYEPKRREIYKLPYRDRVAQWAIMQILEPLWTPTFTADTYACIKGRGIHSLLRNTP